MKRIRTNGLTKDEHGYLAEIKFIEFNNPVYKNEILIINGGAYKVIDILAIEQFGFTLGLELYSTREQSL